MLYIGPTIRIRVQDSSETHSKAVHLQLEAAGEDSEHSMSEQINGLNCEYS